MNGFGEGCERRQADRRLSGGERDATSCGDADAQDGKASGSGGHGDTIECGEGELGPVEDAPHERHQRLCGAAVHRHRFEREHVRTRSIEHPDRASLKCGIDGKDTHDSNLARYNRFSLMGAKTRMTNI